MKDRIWEAFMQRVVQEERLKAMEKKTRLLTAYYAAFAVAAAVLSALEQTAVWRVPVVILAVLSSILTIFLCSDPFSFRLQLIRRDQAELEALYNGADSQDEDSIRQRMQLITACGAGASAQDRRAYERMKDRSEKWQAMLEGRPVQPRRLFGYEKFLYWSMEIIQMILLAVAVLLPLAGIVLAACGLL